MTFPTEEVEGKGSELDHALSWRDQMLSLSRHHSDWGEEKVREVGKENQRKMSSARCPRRQEDSVQGPLGLVYWRTCLLGMGTPKAPHARLCHHLLLFFFFNRLFYLSS